MGECKYYKHILPTVVTFFYAENDNILGMFREIKTKNNLSLMRDIDTSLWRNVSVNDLAKNLVEHSQEITELEYNTAKYMLDAFIDSQYWMITEDKVPVSCEAERKVVSETVYC